MTVVSDFTALLDVDLVSWSGNGTLGRPAFITYSFDVAAPDYVDLEPAFTNSFQPLSGLEMQVARDALGQWDVVSGLHFIEVPAGQGDMRFGLYNFNLSPDFAEFGGFAYFPYVEITSDYAFKLDIGGDIFIDFRSGPELGLYLHEIGHAIGLKHPFEDEPTLIDRLDNTSFTTMSYTGGWRDILGTLDIMAAQHIYGTVDGGHLVHWAWDPATLTLTQIDGVDGDTLIGVSVADVIDGAGGDDRIAGFEGQDLLTGGAGSDLIFGGEGDDVLVGGSGADILDGGDGTDVASYGTATNGVEIELGQSGAAAGDALGDIYWDIEIIAGSPHDDRLLGDGGANDLHGAAGDDLLSGLGGDDNLVGGLGTDTASFRGDRGDYTVTKVNGAVLVADAGSTGDGRDSLSGVELFEFTDGTYSLSELIAPDITENGVYRFFNAATGTHFYSATTEERDAVINALDSFLYEGAAFGAAPEGADSSATVWRLFNTETGVHFFTISAAERDAIIDALPQFLSEGAAYNAYEGPVEGTTALHRFFNDQTGTHFYTASETERDAVDAGLPEYTYEGIAYYVDVV